MIVGISSKFDGSTGQHLLGMVATQKVFLTKHLTSISCLPEDATEEDFMQVQQEFLDRAMSTYMRENGVQPTTVIVYSDRTESDQISKFVEPAKSVLIKVNQNCRNRF